MYMYVYVCVYAYMCVFILSLNLDICFIISSISSNLSFLSVNCGIVFKINDRIYSEFPFGYVDLVYLYQYYLICEK